MAINSNFAECDYGRANPKKKCHALAMIRYEIGEKYRRPGDKYPRAVMERSYCHAHANEFEMAFAAQIEIGIIVRVVL